MEKRILALFFSFVLFCILTAGAEMIFRLNSAFHWWEKPKFNSEGTPDNESPDLKRSEEILKAVLKNPVAKWKPLIQEEEHEAIKTEGVDLNGVNFIPNPTSEPENCAHRSIDIHRRSAISYKLIYSSHYKSDGQCRRITPQNSSANTKVLMFGDSYTLGEGVSDTENTPYFLSTMRTDLQIYNLGRCGGGLNDALDEIRDPQSVRLQKMAPGKTIALYTFISHHMERFFARSTAFRKENNWMINKTKYILKEGKLEAMGSFLYANPLRSLFYTALSRSHLVDFFNIVIPPRFYPSDFDLFAFAVSELKRNIQAKYENAEFYFVIFPNVRVHRKELLVALKKYNIPILDYGRIQFLAKGKSFIIPGDGHPSPLLHYAFASLLSQDLPKMNAATPKPGPHLKP